MREVLSRVSKEDKMVVIRSGPGTSESERDGSGR